MIRMLVVDDEPAFSGMVAGYFSNLGCEVVSVASAEAALELWPKFVPDICVIDNRLPGMSGVQLIARIRRFDPNVFIVMSTIDRREDVLPDQVQDRIDLFFKKPLPFAVFCDALVGAIAGITAAKTGGYS